MISGLAAVIFELALLAIVWTAAIVYSRRTGRPAGVRPIIALIVLWGVALATLVHDIREVNFVFRLRSISGDKVKSVKLGSNALPSDIVYGFKDSSLLKFTQKRMHYKPVQLVIEKSDGRQLTLDVAREGQGVRIQEGGLSAYSASLGNGLIKAGIDLPHEN